MPTLSLSPSRTLTWRSSPYRRPSSRGAPTASGYVRAADRRRPARRARPARPQPSPALAIVEIDSAAGRATLVNGRARVVAAATGLVSFHDTVTGKEVLSEAPRPLLVAGRPAFRGARHRPVPDRAALRPSYPDERVYGRPARARAVGSEGHGHRPRQHQRRCHPSSSLAAATACCGTTWSGGSSSRSTAPAGSPTRPPARLLATVGRIRRDHRAYARATGFPSAMPEWASGFWQSKLLPRPGGTPRGGPGSAPVAELPLSV